MSALPSLGHVNPCLAIGRVLREAGHDVRLATAPGMADRIRAAGVQPAIMGFDVPRPGETFTRELEERYRRWLLASFGFWVDDLVEQARDWRPDVLLHDWSEAAGMFAAKRLGLPAAVLGVERRPPVAEITRNPCWLGFDFEELGGMRGVFGDLLLNPYPPCLATPGDAILPNEHYIQPLNYDAADGSRDGPPAVPGDAPLVYVTIGTFYGRAEGVFERIIATAATVDARFVITTGPGHEVADFAPLPENVRVEQYVPQSLLIPHCSAVLCHGGLNVVVPALAHGVPIGCLPVLWTTAEEHSTVRHCERLGVAAGYPADADALAPGELDEGHIRAMITALLGEPSYRRAAARVQAEIASLPDAHRAVEMIEDLT